MRGWRARTSAGRLDGRGVGGGRGSGAARGGFLARSRGEDREAGEDDGTSTIRSGRIRERIAGRGAGPAEPAGPGRSGLGYEFRVPVLRSGSMPEYIYAVRNLQKKYGTKEVLRGITLAFYYGAKIGVIGHNGSGKSTLLRIMAGPTRSSTARRASSRLDRRLRPAGAPARPDEDRASATSRTPSRPCARCSSGTSS